MTKNILKLGLLTTVLVTSACNLTQKTPEDRQIIGEAPAVVNSISVNENNLRKNLQYLTSNELRGRETGTEGIEKAARFIEKEFAENKVKPFFKTYRDSFQIKGRTGYNIVGYLEGNDPVLKDQYLILGAHYDHVGIQKAVNGDSIANGANDNAAGTVAVMELAKQFAREGSNKRSVMFILFSAEEMGLEGAKHIASRLKREGIDLYAMVNFEMIGVPMKGKDHLAYLTGYENSNLAEKFNQYSGSKILGFLPQAKQYNLFQRSDNYSFYKEFKVPAQTISTFDFTNYEYYHHVADEAEKMDYSHMVNLIESVWPGLESMANTPQKEIKLN